MEKTTSSTCIEMDALLEAHLDGELGEFETARVRRHLDGCPRCQHELAWARQIRQGLRELPQLACPASVMENVRLERLRAAGSSSATGASPPPEPRESLSASTDEETTADAPPVSAVPDVPHHRRSSGPGWRAALVAASLSAALFTGWLLHPLFIGPLSNPPASTADHTTGDPTTGDAESLQPDRSVSGQPDAPVRAEADRPPPAPQPASVAAASPDTENLEPAEPSPEELARAKEEVELALACLGAVNRRAAVELRDRALAHRIAETPERVLEHLSRQL